jgi:Reverse transcriptase (RNA-dependent DNA polymerase)
VVINKIEIYVIMAHRLLLVLLVYSLLLLLLLRKIVTIDFRGAFLNSDHVVFMRINKYLTNVLTSLDSSYKKFVNANGTCVVKLKKALYGCVESAKLWYDKISTDLITVGYKINNTDICVFNRTEQNNKQTTLVIHVDDMMTTSTDNETIDRTISEIENLYHGLTKTRGNRYDLFK